MEINCMIIDDEPPAQRVLEKFIAEISSLKLVAKCFNAREALDLLHRTPIDLIFLDINMPVMSGLAFFRSLQNPPLAIITTAYREYALEGYELNVVDYLTKPITFERFFFAVDKAMNRLNTSNLSTSKISQTSMERSKDFIFVKDDKVTYKIDIDKILYIESMGDYVKIITEDKNYISNQTMKRIEELLIRKDFPRIHKSFLVNLSKIESIMGNMICIKKFNIPIGKTYRKDFFDLLSEK